MNRTVLAVYGMSSNQCRERVVELLSALSGVLDVQVSLIRGNAIVTHTAACSPASLVSAIIRAGFHAEHTALD